MENKQMYVVTMSSGSHDSYEKEIVGVTDDFDKANSYVNKMNETFSSMDQKVNAFYRNEYVIWHKDNPPFDTQVKGLVEIPKWLGNQKITKEMRKARKALELINSEIKSKHLEPERKRNENFRVFFENWLKTNLTKEEFELYAIRDENHWYVEEVKWI